MVGNRVFDKVFPYQPSYRVNPGNPSFFLPFFLKFSPVLGQPAELDQVLKQCL